MIKGKVIRQRSTPLGTAGTLVLENGFHCDTQELPWHDNERGVSCTMADIYHGRVWWSPTLKRHVIRFDDKNGRKDCLIHNGNFAADAVDQDGDGAPEVTQVHGCTEVGRGYGEIQRPDGRIQHGVLNSAVTLKALIDNLEDAEQPGGFHEVEIAYEWAEGSAS